MFDSYFLDLVYDEFMKNFFLANSSELMGVWLISASSAQKPFDSYFIDIMYVEFMKKFVLADSSELFAVWLISATWAQKCFIPAF